MKKQLLVVDDEPNIIELIRMNLGKSGFEILPAYTGEEAVLMAGKELPDLILLDIMLPDIDGLEVLRQLRTDAVTAGIPIIMLTARSEETDKVIGLGMGADDYVTKPFGMRELEARVRNALRRSQSPWPPLTAPIRQLQIDNLMIDPDRHQVTYQGEVVDLTPSEFAILLRLAEKPRQVHSRQDLMNALPGDPRSQDVRIVDVHVRNIRKKLGETNDNSRYIETIRGTGYRIGQVPS
ncbi:response regulator transcription factor [Anoxynatronum buryatiense]|uniref:Stage 0 sporulation protein A homolog n=1 Tax=Anoxynatronum buryatiense TaxID=489973 RepID=A0AA45WTM8_9CLOT|nr:response regulator transcription factor [Anoxynatronum buryatiense]SMP44023.1 two-component system, OmpR family, alkaline phosphatase synthesis response regulator PhoP [Anoxynatronum buryatiense]